MQLPESLFDDLFLESHNPLAVQCIKTLYGGDDFIIDEDRNIYLITDCYIDYTKSDFNYQPISKLRKLLIITSLDSGFFEYIRNTNSNFILYKRLFRYIINKENIRLEENRIELEILRMSMII